MVTAMTIDKEITNQHDNVSDRVPNIDDIHKKEEFDIEINGTVGKPFVDDAKMSSRNCDVFYGHTTKRYGRKGRI